MAVIMAAAAGASLAKNLRRVQRSTLPKMTITTITLRWVEVAPVAAAPVPVAVLT